MTMSMSAYKLRCMLSVLKEPDFTVDGSHLYWFEEMIYCGSASGTFSKITWWKTSDNKYELKFLDKDGYCHHGCHVSASKKYESWLVEKELLR